MESNERKQLEIIFETQFDALVKTAHLLMAGHSVAEKFTEGLEALRVLVVEEHGIKQ